MVKAWTTLVAPEDQIWHLGDLYLPSWQQKEWWQHRITALPGIKHLILGNHDHRVSISRFKGMGFEVHKKPIWFNYGEKAVVLSHNPYSGHEPFSLNLHGHLHEKTCEGIGTFANRVYRCVSVEQTDYSPVLLDDLLRGMLGPMEET
jgi:calcineurin-like phosphoesterase family protein